MEFIYSRSSPRTVGVLSTFDLEDIGINAGNWVDSAQDRDYWRALVNAALKPPCSKIHGVS